ncbi:MAG: serine hydrolase [Bacteroidetes bacterium]|nr:serine hydrolase [Bacteroidota bacterium]
MRSSRLLALVGLLLLLAAPVRSQQAPVDLQALDAYIAEAVTAWETPGTAVGIVYDDALLFAKGYGTRTLGTDTPVDAQTLFDVASNSKAFTAALLGMLVDEGQLDWDDRVIDYLPDFRLHDPWITRQITIRDLLTHRSGLPTFGGDHLWIGNDLSQDEIIDRLPHLEPTGAFRADFRYQNLMYHAAGEVIEAVTGQTWDALVHERILDPLGMTRTTTTVDTLDAVPNVADAHEVVNDTLRVVAYDDVDAIPGAAGLNSTVEDMSRWMRLTMRGGHLDGDTLLQPATARAMQTIQMPLPVSPWSAENLERHFYGYGLGWFISDYKGEKMVSHSGGLTGMISLQTLLPERGLGVIVLTNRAPNRLPWAITYRILDAFLEEPPRDWSAEYLERQREAEARADSVENALRQARVADAPMSLPLERYAGTYANPLSGEATVRLEGDHLVFDYNPRHLGDLEPWHFDTFRTTWRHPLFDMPPRSFLQFHLTPEGGIDGLTVTFYRPITFERVSD